MSLVTTPTVAPNSPCLEAEPQRATLLRARMSRTLECCLVPLSGTLWAPLPLLIASPLIVPRSVAQLLTTNRLIWSIRFGLRRLRIFLIGSSSLALSPVCYTNSRFKSSITVRLLPDSLRPSDLSINVRKPCNP